MASHAEYTSDGDFAPMTVIAACFEQGTQALLIDRPYVPPAFFDLRTGVTGELVQKLTLYGIRLACVVPDLHAQPDRFREFAREANQGGQVRFFESRGAAVEWLARE